MRQRRPLRWAAAWAVGTAAALTSSVILCGLPYWQGNHPWAAAATICCCAGLGIAGVLMQTEHRTHACGIMLVLAGVTWSATWSQSWNSGCLPVVGQFSQSLCFLAVGIGILQYVHPGRPDVPERCWIAVASFILLAGTAASILVSEPRWMGYRPGVFWPGSTISYSHFHWLITVLRDSFIGLAAAYAFVLIRRARERMPRKYRRLTAPLLFLIMAGAVTAAWAEQGSTLTNLSASLETFAFQSLIGLLLLAALLCTGLADRFAGLLLKNRLISRASPPTMRGLRDAIADAFDDSQLQIYYRIPDSDQYVDSQGGFAGAFGRASWDEQSGDGRYACEVFASAGVLTAVIDLDRKLSERRGLLDSAKSVARLLLMHSDLREEVEAAGMRLRRQSQTGVLQTGITERQRLERDLHDGAQQMLIALSMKMGAAAVSLSDPGMRELLAGWQRNLRDATDELRNLARGIYPATLREQGVRAALDSLAERQTDLYVDLEVPDLRFPPVVETTLYFAVAEAVANVAKHAQASKARVRAVHDPPWLTCTVQDDGNGQAAQRPGGGLEGIVNRIRVLGGDVRVAASPGEGSTIEMRVPCE